MLNAYSTYLFIENDKEIEAAKYRLTEALNELIDRPFFSKMQQFDLELMQHVTATTESMRKFARLQPVSENWQQTVTSHSVPVEKALQGLAAIVDEYTGHILFSIRLQNNFFMGVLVICVILIIFLDIKRRYEESTTERMRSLSRRYMKELERSHKKTVLDIHDVVLQELAIVRHFTHLIRSKPDMKKKEKAWETISSSLLKSTKTLRNIIDDIQPWNTNITSFSTSIQNVIEPFSDTIEIIYQSNIDNLPEEQWTSDEKNQLLSIIHEALSNVRKHAEASEVIISVTYSNNLLRITIHDNGKGFSPVKNNHIFDSNHIGLFSMKERAAMIGGTVSIHSEPGIETSVLIEVKKEERNNE